MRFTRRLFCTFKLNPRSHSDDAKLHVQPQLTEVRQPTTTQQCAGTSQCESRTPSGRKTFIRHLTSYNTCHAPCISQLFFIDFTGLLFSLFYLFPPQCHVFVV